MKHSMFTYYLTDIDKNYLKVNFLFFNDIFKFKISKERRPCASPRGSLKGEDRF